jgi:hypothetical protein
MPHPIVNVSPCDSSSFNASTQPMFCPCTAPADAVCHRPLQVFQALLHSGRRGGAGRSEPQLIMHQGAAVAQTVGHWGPWQGGPELLRGILGVSRGCNPVLVGWQPAP